MRAAPGLCTCANASITVLETRVRATGVPPHANLFLVTIDVLDPLIGAAYEPALRSDWIRVGKTPRSTVESGRERVTQAKALAMKVPSVVCPADFNYIRNPQHPDMRDVAVVGVEAFNLDQRLFR
jgi:hypothetical protein